MKRIDFNALYLDTTNIDVGNSAGDARANNQKYYRGICKVHGNTILGSKDNNCCLCSRERSRKRYKSDHKNIRLRDKFLTSKKRAEKRKLDFDLTFEDFKSLFEATTKCPILGLEFVATASEEFDSFSSIDRVDSRQGYIANNVAVISNRANRLKGDGAPEEHIKIALWQLRMQGKSKEEIFSIIGNILNANSRQR